MPRFMLRRVWDDLSPDEMRRVTFDMIDLSAAYGGVRWLHSHPAVDAQGHLTTFCVYESPSRQAVLDHAAAVGHHSVDEISEIEADVEATDDGAHRI